MTTKDVQGNVTRVPTDYFQNPVVRLGVSGGTAPFFSLKLTPLGQEKLAGPYGHPHLNGHISESHFIGKDLSRAVDEVEFYEQTLEIQAGSSEGKDEGGLEGLLGYTFQYVGIVTLEETVNGEPVERELLVLQNLYDSLTKLRLLDFKMGDKTADVNWRGKSRARAYKQRVLDTFTNSTKEGFRLEGFDGQPSVVTSMDPLLDLKFSRQRDITKEPDKKAGQKAARMALQRMNGKQVLMHYLDLHVVPPHNRTPLLSVEGADVYTKSEIAEIVLHESVRRLVQLSVACHTTTVPQKWLGSSIALGYDYGAFPTRSESNEQLVRDNVIVNIFDWGRSECLTKEAYEGLTAVEQEDRKKYWDFYMHGADTLSFVAARRYHNQFSNKKVWNEVRIRVMDYDSSNNDDFMGEINLPLPRATPNETWSEEFQLRNKGKPYVPGRTSGGQRGTIKVEITWVPVAEDMQSRIKGSWHIRIVSGSSLLKKDILTSDPYCLVTANGVHHQFTQMTSVKINTLNPVWNEVLEIPVVSCSTELMDSLEASGLKVDPSKLNELFRQGDDVNADWLSLF